MNALFTTSSVLTTALGVLWLFAPRFILDQWGTTSPDPITIYMSQRYGGLFFGYAVLMWLARPGAPSPMRYAVLAGGLAVSSVMAVVSIMGAVRGVVGPVIWSAAAIEIVLAAWFGYFLARERRSY